MTEFEKAMQEHDANYDKYYNKYWMKGKKIDEFIEKHGEFPSEDYGARHLERIQKKREKRDAKLQTTL